MTVSAYYDDIAKCNKCGFCHVACPIFRTTGHESGVARGRLALLRGIIEKRVEWNEELEDPLFTCLGCGACTTNCFGKIPTTDLVLNARAEYLDKIGKKPAHRLLFEHLLPYPKRLHVAARAVALGKNSGASKVANALGLLRIFGRDLPKAEGMVDKLPMSSFRGTVKPGVYPGTGDKLKIGYFVGCGMDVIQVQAGKATFEVLKTKAKSVTVMDNCCCGLPPYTYGDLGNTKLLARKNLDVFEKLDVDLIVTDCSSCASFLKKYPKIFKDDERDAARANKELPMIKDVVEFLYADEQDGKKSSDEAAGSYHDAHASAPQQLTGTGKGSVIVTYHDPCHAVRGQGIKDESRGILKNLPGVTFKEMAEADWCCGGAGSYALTHYDLSQKVLDRKMKNLKDTDADILVTSCPACMIQLAYGIKRHGMKTKVFHISEMLDYQEQLKARQQ
ncbi:(Fe-S)-binding protein [Desulfofustis glycolicus]|uniref:Glycolate oxidase iron-sulfur subunit n=1 Tax=Desulfofustis glycolicus DSM 9705 TaxID=1121409 RepID=A0A1M5T5V0_9BACT|nr:(Fe-S)-binding protein [Desulfofustis glycolicus]SHH46082.1 glycolate oxidase iron-sulfur subunit [Desulfofustis glycolicus DSM 9705]